MQVDGGRSRRCAGRLCLAAFRTIPAPRHLVREIPVARQRGAVVRRDLLGKVRARSSPLPCHGVLRSRQGQSEEGAEAGRALRPL